MTDAGVNSGRGPGETSSTLLVRLKAKDPEAWRRFVYLYSPRVYRWCRRAGLREADAADVGQEVFQAVAGAIGTFHHDQKGDSFRGWLRTITHNKVLDFDRRQPPSASGVGGSAGQARLFELEQQKKEAEFNAIVGEKKDIAWGSQIRSYVFQPYQMVKDHRTGVESGNIQAVMDGELDAFIEGYLTKQITANK